MARLFPMFVKLDKRPVLVVGAGRVVSKRFAVYSTPGLAYE